MQLRPYQSEAIDAVFDWWGSRKGEHPLVVLPTASGKTIIFSSLLKRLMHDHPDVRALILAHRQELLEQAEKKLLSVWPSAPTAVYCAGLGRRELNAITIASRDSLARRVTDMGFFDLVIVDEAHNISTKEETRYQQILAELVNINPTLTVLGYTATPYRRTTGFIHGPGRLFAGVAYEKTIKNLVDEKFLARVIGKQVDKRSEIDVAGLRTVAGDFNLRQLDERANTIDVVEASIDEWQRLAWETGRRSTVFFCVSVHHAERVSRNLWGRGHDMPVVSAETPQRERRKILRQFDSGELKGIVNVGVLTEGWDAPRLDCIALMRPTKSLGLFLQMVGRGLRLSPETGKENCLLLDFGGCLTRFGPIDIARPPSKRKDLRTKVCPECDSVVGFFKRKCPDCGYQFQPDPHKICDHCGEENHPAAQECIACHQPFTPKIDTKASTAPVLSDEIKRDVQRFTVDRVTCDVGHSRSNGRPYLRLIFQCGLLNRFNKVFCIGYPGYAGRKAIRDLSRLVIGDLPDDPEEAVFRHQSDLQLGGSGLFRPIKAIHVDVNSKYQDVVYIEQGTNESAAA